MSAQKSTQTQAFSFRTMLALVLVGVLCLAGIGILSAYEPELKSGNDGQAHALSRSSVGYLALARLLEKEYYDVILDRKGIAEDYSDAVVITTPTVSVEGERLKPFLRDGPTIIVLPKWLVNRDEEKRSWSNLMGRLPPDEALDILPDDVKSETSLSEASQTLTVNLTYRSPFVGGTMASFGQSKAIKNLRSIKGADWSAVLAGPDGSAIIAKHKKLNLYVVADPDIVNNAGIANLPNARFMVHFLTDISNDDNPIIFDLTLNGFQRQPNLGRLFIQPPLLGATLCFVLASLLVAIQAAIRFLPPLEAGRVVALGKRVLADNTAGLIRMGKREHLMAVPYANMIKRQVAKAVGAPASLDAEAQTAMLDRMGELSQSDRRFSSLLSEAATTPDPAALIKLAQNLHAWKQETTREHQ
jgi:hypothetical protein